MRNLMDFQPSPYNSMQMYLEAKEVIRGNQHNPTNVFQWDTICLNLPGTKDYNPPWTWILKHRVHGLLASDFACFVDDL